MGVWISCAGASRKKRNFWVCKACYKRPKQSIYDTELSTSSAIKHLAKTDLSGHSMNKNGLIYEKQQSLSNYSSIITFPKLWQINLSQLTIGGKLGEGFSGWIVTENHPLRIHS